MARILITTSWDDGYQTDHKLVDLLCKYSIPGMLFIPAENPERAVIPPSEIRILSQIVEIGSHTYSHQYLNKCDIATGLREIQKGREYLEHILGHPVAHFCFPGGKTTNEIEAALPKFVKSARTTQMYGIAPSTFICNPTLQLFHHRPLVYLKKAVCCIGKDFSARWTLVGPYIFFQKWYLLIQKIIQTLDDVDGDIIIHCWGHSWEIHEYGLWNELEDLFRCLHDYRSYLVRYDAIFVNR